MEYFWKGGIQKLDNEMEVHDMLCSSQEKDLEMFVTTDTMG
jgi:hypothetical protein